MARIPYADTGDPATAALVARVRAERDGDLPHLYAMLLHAPTVADGWLGYLTAIRTRCTLAPAIRELVIMRIARLNGAPYEADQHRPHALAAGLTEAKLAALAGARIAPVFEETEARVLAYCDAMTREVTVSDDTFAAVASLFEPQELVELTATIAAYNMVSRFLVALRIDEADPI